MDGQCEVSDWTEIEAIAAGDSFSAGLKENGTVCVTTCTDSANSAIHSWTDIIAISAGPNHLLGLRKNGTILSTMIMDDEQSGGQCSVSDWSDIVAVAAGGMHSLGLKADGSVVATAYLGDSKRNYGQCAVSDWKLFSSIDVLVSKQKENTAKAEEKRREIEESAKTELEERINSLKEEQATLQLELPNVGGLFAAKKKAKIRARLAEIEEELNALM